MCGQKEDNKAPLYLDNEFRYVGCYYILLYIIYKYSSNINSDCEIVRF